MSSPSRNGGSTQHRTGNFMSGRSGLASREGIVRLDSTSVRCAVFVYREGLLSAVGHDLKLTATRFTIDVDWEAKRVRAQFDAASLRVECAMVDGKERPGEPGDADRRKIEGNIVDDVLRVDRYPSITFESTGVREAPDGYSVEGRLSLHGTEKAVAFGVQVHEGRATARIALDQPSFKIRPFSAILGTLRIKPRVDVVIDAPVP
jgi:polyisoprenoid-binding protein YceI